MRGSWSALAFWRYSRSTSSNWEIGGSFAGVPSEEQAEIGGRRKRPAKASRIPRIRFFPMPGTQLRRPSYGFQFLQRLNPESLMDSAGRFQPDSRESDEQMLGTRAPTQSQ